jgi:hypothetical protein
MKKSLNPFAYLCAGAGIGAGLMFILDPAGGRRRRALVRDKTRGAWNDATGAVRRRSRDAANHVRGAAASARSLFRRREASDDDVLAARVRSRIGHVISHPGALDILARGGAVTLGGPVLAGEVTELLAAVSAVKGVERVNNRLEVHQSADISALQGGARRS